MYAKCSAKCDALQKYIFVSNAFAFLHTWQLFRDRPKVAGVLRTIVAVHFVSKMALQKYIFASGQNSYRHAEHFAYKMGAVKTEYFYFLKM